MQQKKQSIVIFGGGLDQITPALQVESGRLLISSNFEAALNGGYRRIEGFERLDGQPSPVDTPFYTLTAPFVSLPDFDIGETVTGGTSGATGVVLAIEPEGIYVVDTVGTFVDAETITGGTSGSVRTTTQPQLENTILTVENKAQEIRYAKELYYRDKILPVPTEGTIVGDNPVRGQFTHLDLQFAIRDWNVSEARLYVATPTGWVQQSLGHIIWVDTVTDKDLLLGGLDINDGNGNTATVERVSYPTFDGDTGYIVVSGYTAGFNALDPINDGAAGVTQIAAVTTTAEEIKLPPGGRYEFISHNFFGGVDSYRVYGCNGVGYAFEFDGTVFSPIYSDQANIASDNPKYLRVYKNALFFGYERGIIRGSENGDPFLWDASLGAIEIGVGAAVTGLDATPASMVVTTSRQTLALFGDTVLDYQLRVISENTGAKDYTLQHIGTSYMLDDRGIIELTRVEAFGAFENATISRSVQPTIELLRDDVTASSISLRKNLYRLFTRDGRGIVNTFQEGQVVGFAQFALDRDIFSITNAEDETGVERILFGGNDGYVYELDKGRTFDGEAIKSFMRPVFHFAESPTLRKRFYRAFFDFTISGTATLEVSAEYAVGSPDVKTLSSQDAFTAGLSGLWDVDSWNAAILDAKLSADSYIDLTGTGDSIGLILRNESPTDDVFTLKDVIYHYKTRRIMRNAR